MKQRLLPGTDLEVPVLSLGTMTFGGQTDEVEARSIMAAALERGVTLFDTANVYTGGESEAIVGRFLKGRRDQVILATKVGNPVAGSPGGGGLGALHMRWSAEASLKRLGTDVIDLFYLHLPDHKTPIDETLVTMDALVRDGLVRYWGVSNYAAWQVAAIVERCRARGLAAPVISQNVYNLLTRGIEAELVPCLKAYDIGLTVYNPLVAGLLTGKHRNEEPEDGTRFTHTTFYYDRYWNRRNLEAVKGLQEVAEMAGLSLLELALSWVMGQPGVLTTLVGASRLAQIEENLTVAERVRPLSEITLAACDEIWAELAGKPFSYIR
ncbi:MAG: aldo/keto reductase [Bacillota bacterium]|nr:aldo/keto reductase [Bacillota bacterium]